ncbi:hypothetical protein T484DRAFT_1885839 [Baffinella frigidus]|nr:hypothetical protein T484DRAFT_1885839 [Cryptophyta sp. CCMP2293]
MLNDDVKILAAASLIQTHARREDLESAEGIFRQAKKAGGGGLQKVYTAMISAYCHLGMLEVYSPIISAYCHLGMLQEAEDLLVEMQEEGLPPSAVTLQILIDAFAAKGDVMTAMQFFWEGRVRNVHPFCSFMVKEGKILVLDLHGMSALTATVAVDLALTIRPPLPGEKLEIVTGRGLHSLAGRAVLRPAVERHLKREGFNFSQTAGNEGRLQLIADSKALPIVAFSLVLIIIMWTLGAIAARDWLTQVRLRTAENQRERELERLRTEIRTSLAEHARGTRERDEP